MSDETAEIKLDNIATLLIDRYIDAKQDLVLAIWVRLGNKSFIRADLPEYNKDLHDKHVDDLFKVMEQAEFEFNGHMDFLKKFSYVLDNRVEVIVKTKKQYSYGIWELADSYKDTKSTKGA